MHTVKKTKHSLVLILCIIVGLISALYLVMERNTIEKAQNHIENIVDYDAVLRANAFEKRSQKDAFDALKEALSSIGVTGLTVTQVLGCGVQKGQSEFYRGVPMDVTLLPKVKVEVVVSRVPVRSVIDVTKRVLYTGHIGDGKIFVYNVENVVKVRTGEEGVAALQDTH